MPEAPIRSFADAVAYAKTPAFRKLFRYACVSGISTVLSIVTLYVFYRVVGLAPFWANIVATIITTVPSYYLNRAWAWGRSGKSHFRKEVLPFWVIAFVSLAISSLAVWFADHEATVNHFSHTTQTIVVLGANFVTYGTLWIVKFTIFNKILFKHHDADIEPIVLVPVD